MKHLSLERAYFVSPPIFCHDIDSMGVVEYDKLPISGALICDLIVWDSEYQATLNVDVPQDSVMLSPDSARLHIERGRVLTKRLQAELGDGYSVSYRP